ncbi:restriction endonuclease subunit S [Shewanella sp. 10N.286.48.B5]|uniref:restriction endonuclease subunit S n=1 Tax=Shewanella sp. 10N.286.48.B5 TaxID=1880834 RepID=UPI0018E447A4|nr:restriction endonuclease subunit S [Shewanella sp. 10N.286.48.B5]
MDELTIMPKYKAYKNSGEDWIGDVPSNWDVVPIRSIFKFRNEKNDPVITDNILSLSIAHGVTEYSEEGRGGNKRKDDLSAYKIARPNDIVMNSMNVIVGAVGLSKYFGAISPVYYALYTENKGAYIHYYEKVFQNESFQRGLLKFGKGILIKLSGTGKLNTIRMKVSTDDLKTLNFPKPPYDEQVAIASFLDKKTAQIDEAIAIKEKQIELLKERKQIIIQQAVTQGLNSDVRLIETELSWAPKIASHWSLLPNRLFMEMRRVPVGHAYKNYQLLSLTKQGVLIRDLSQGAGKQSDFLERMQEVRKGDLIFCLFDVEETPRTVGLSGHLGMISADYTIFECSDELTGRFLEYFYKNADDQKSLKPLYKGLRKRIPKPRFLRTKCPMPPRNELIKIIQYLDAQEVKTAQSIELIVSQIEKLKEYKTTLNNSAVTGKIKVI